MQGSLRSCDCTVGEVFLHKAAYEYSKDRQPPGAGVSFDG